MMYMDGTEFSRLDSPRYETFDNLRSLHEKFQSDVAPLDGCYQKLHPDMDANIARWLDLGSPADVGALKPNLFGAVRQMYHGVALDGKQTLGLKEIGNWEVHPEYKAQNIKQHAGFAAEVISTAKENLLAQKNNTGVVTYRLDDLAGHKNDPYVDKVRLNQNGEVIGRIQTKFVGKDGAGCLAKLVSPKYEKYLNDGKVDKLEIPKDYYDEIKNGELIEKELAKLDRQLARASADGKTDTVQNIQNKIQRYKKVDTMLERSTVTQKEAIFATKHPKAYSAKLFV